MPEHDILLALSTARRLAAIILGRPATDDSEAVEVYRRWQQVDAELDSLPLATNAAMNHLVALVQPLNVPFAPLGPASGNPPPPPPPPMPTSTNEGGEEDDDDDNEDDEEDNDVTMSARLHSSPTPESTPVAVSQDPCLVCVSKLTFTGPKKMLKETRAKFNKRRLEYAAQHPDDAGAQNAAKVAIRNQQSVEARKVSRKEKKKEKRKAAKK
ncbi:hypothetical protein LTR61_006002 [Exophiala xenobiotica]|nr:hypothetical protein LTR61_006002 [Exophiala xenobiotica]